MPTFEYQAQNPQGETIQGVAFGVSLDHVAKDLAAQGMLVMRIGLSASINDPLANYAPQTQVAVQEPQMRQAVRAEGAQAVQPPIVETVQRNFAAAPPTEQRSYADTSVWGPLVGQVPLQKVYFFYKQLGTLLQSGVPFVQSLDTLASQARHPKLEGIIKEIKGHVEAGRSMSAGLQRYPEVFSPIMLSLTRAGEEGGFLSDSLLQVAGYLEREIALRNLYRRLTIMPKIQVAASIVIIIATNLIIDSVKPDARHLSSPLTTLSTWMWLGPLIVGVFLFLRVGLANPRIKFNWDLVASNIPGLGKMLRELSAAKFGRAFGALYKGGVPLPKTMEMAADACGNEYLRSKIYPQAKRLTEGAGIAETFRATGAFSPIVLDMVATGESTGDLEQMLTKMAEFYEDEATTKSTQVAVGVGVFVGLCVAIYIGYIVITFWTGVGTDYNKAISGS